DVIVRALLASALAVRFDGRMVLLSGQRLTDHLVRDYSGCGIEFRSVSHGEALSLLGSATMVVTAPGLTTSLESFQLSTPRFFLPPQNSSQWWILDALRRRRLAPCALHWADLEVRRLVPRLLPQEAREILVREIISELLSDAATVSRLARALTEMATAD